jgi:hypothetical protein
MDGGGEGTYLRVMPYTSTGDLRHREDVSVVFLCSHRAIERLTVHFGLVDCIPDTALGSDE